MQQKNKEQSGGRDTNNVLVLSLSQKYTDEWVWLESQICILWLKVPLCTFQVLDPKITVDREIFAVKIICGLNFRVKNISSLDSSVT